MWSMSRKLAGRHVVGHRFCSSSVSGGSSAVAKLVAAGVAAAGVVTSGVLLCEYVDPSLRSSVELRLPIMCDVNNFLLGDVPFKSNKPPSLLKETRRKEIDGIGSVQKSPVASPDQEQCAGGKIDGDAEVVGIAIPAIEHHTQKPEKGKVVPSPYEGKGETAAKNERLDKRLRSALSSAEQKTHNATRFKLDHIAAVETHVASIKAALEAGPDADWDAVTVAHLAVQRAARRDLEAEAEGHACIDKLQKVVSDGLRGEETALNPLLLNARESAKKWRGQIEETGRMFKPIETEQMIVKDYAHLVEQSRRSFTKELQAVVPSADLSSPNKQQLGALLAHAHLRVDQLRRQLVEQQARQEQLIRERLDREKDTQLKELRRQLSEEGHDKAAPVPESNVAKETSASSSELLRLTADFDAELNRRLESNAAEYSTKLEQVVRTQRQLFDIEKEDSVSAAVAVEKQVNASRIAHAVNQLEAIEQALKDRVVMDAENRRSKQAWLACQNLVDSIEHGKRGACCMDGRRMPLGQQVEVLLKASDKDVFVRQVADALCMEAKIKGVYTRADLETRFLKVLRVGSRVSRVGEDGGGIGAFLRSWIASSLSILLPVNYGNNVKFDPTSSSNQELLERSRWFFAKEDLLGASKLLQHTTGATRRVSYDWIRDVRSHEESLMLARLLLAHAAVTSMRSTY